jgi:site-specific DNA recombinase
MSNKKYFSYIRVSTQRQGQSGTSLAEQQAAIERYASSWNLSIVKRFEERETAAKLGRPVFLEMLKALKQGKANGVIIHKIDRSARNLKDWADLGSLIDSGIEVHFASESLDLNSRGGRLSADIQAVVASDYIRNLREETKKGIYGRLRQGLYPFPAVIGYLDTGKGNPKKPDSKSAFFIKQAFELYATGNWGLIALADKLYESGLRNKNGNRITINGLSTILHNPFYMGVIKIERTDEMFAGIHEPIISKKLYDEVQVVLEGKKVKKQKHHFFVFRRKIRCRNCRNLFIPERQKTYVYYRCHTQSCRRGMLKEETVEAELFRLFDKMQLTPAEYRFLRKESAKEDSKALAELETTKRQLLLSRDRIKDRLSKLADAYVDGVFDKEIYLEKKNSLIFEEQSVKEKLNKFKEHNAETTKRFELFLELANSAYLSYIGAKPEDRRDLVKITASNFWADGKSVSVKLETPFQTLAERAVFTSGSPYRETTRTLKALFKKLFVYFKDLNEDTSKSNDEFINYVTSKSEKSNGYNSLTLN